ncbi:arginase family protein [Aeromicrobium sp. CnD17-E]|uniref:arginase family protein n=1 Tax=Aeromicrobium sp. CnD17-E TaxID=2954487 RepID=UPI0020969153|nr:arginase family protein [Aeromicrobium sp. CnD17-E]MCO7237663.1 arginase family protein [Aeromicrobium sp. CnD17-E]
MTTQTTPQTPLQSDGTQAPIAVTHFAGRAGDHNDHAMAASPRLAAAFADRYQVTPTVVGTPRPALCTTWDVELEAAREELAEMSQHYQTLFAAGATPVTALSRCAVALSTLPVVAQHRPDAVVVWFDAHADINLPESTTTGYLGGLALSGPLGLWDSGLGAGLGLGNAILAGVRDIDPPENGLIETTDLTLVSPGPGFGDRLGEAVAGRPVYVHVDCDVMDPGIVPTDYLVADGLSLTELHDAAAALARSEIVGIEVGELETVTGEEDLTAILTALAPVLDALR